MPKSGPDLFSVDSDDHVRDWGALVKDIEKQRPSLLGLWKEEYDRWKHGYQRFRDCEEIAFFTPTEAGDLKPLEDQVLRFHRRAILALLGSGEKCETHLSQLALEDDEESQDRLICLRRIRTLLDSLRESLDLWHPVNAERVTELRKMASH
jgi:hypothetical protein